MTKLFGCRRSLRGLMPNHAVIEGGLHPRLAYLALHFPLATLLVERFLVYYFIVESDTWLHCACSGQGRAQVTVYKGVFPPSGKEVILYPIDTDHSLRAATDGWGARLYLKAPPSSSGTCAPLRETPPFYPIRQSRILDTLAGDT